MPVVAKPKFYQDAPSVQTITGNELLPLIREDNSSPKNGEWITTPIQTYGTFTPTIQGQDYSIMTIQNANWHIIANRIFIHCQLYVIVNNPSNPNFIIQGLPKSSPNQEVFNLYDMDTSYLLQGNIRGNSLYVKVWDVENTGYPDHIVMCISGNYRFNP